jgi:hypothetical protein
MRDLIKSARGIACLTTMILAMGGVNCANAGSFTVDQSQTVLSIFISLRFASPVGQEFRPTFSSLDGIEILLEDGGVGRGPQAKFSLTIHELGGPDIGTSAIVTLATGFNRGVVFFDFPSPVPLVPGNFYAFGLTQLEGDVYFVGGSIEDFYPPGSAIVFGSAVPPGFLVQDLYFREGITLVPEPPAVTLLAMGCLGLVGLRRFIGPHITRYGSGRASIRWPRPRWRRA